MAEVRHGIFDIEGSPLEILVDTNVIIHLEDNKVIDRDFASFYQVAIANRCKVSFHPACLKDIARDKDEVRRAITLSKFQKYSEFANPGIPTADFIQKIGQTRINDEMDNHQLFQVFCGYADFLITEDAGIKSKARSIGVGEKILSVSEALVLLREKFSLIIPEHPLLVHCSIRDIEAEINDAFFDSLREGYGGFNEWFKKCAIKNRKCYVLKIDGRLSAILIYNLENVGDHDVAGIKESMLKMCTFKVDHTVFGYRLGELFLQKMFELCISAGINHLYLTVFPEHVHLIRLLEKFGFRKEEFSNKNKQQEFRMIKSLVKDSYVQTTGTVEAHPFYRDSADVNKYVVPIQKKYYQTLFKDGSLREPELFDQTRDSLNEIQGNTISKAYICASKRLNMKPGDLLLFYSSGQHKTIEPIGVLDSVIYTKNTDELKALVKSRTVYSDVELEDMIHGREVTVLLFRLIYYLQNSITHLEIRGLKSYANNFQTLTQLHEEDYINLKTKKYFDERFIVN